MNDYSLMVNYN